MKSEHIDISKKIRVLSSCHFILGYLLTHCTKISLSFCYFFIKQFFLIETAAIVFYEPKKKNIVQNTSNVHGACIYNSSTIFISDCILHCLFLFPIHFRFMIKISSGFSKFISTQNIY